MATLAPFGLAPSQRHVGQVREYIIRSTDTLAYGVGDPVKSTNVLFQGRLPDGRPTQGMPGVTKASSGDRIRGVIVGVAPALLGTDSMAVPATKARDYVVLVNDDPRTVYEIQANNTSALGTLTGSYANFVAASPTGSVSGMYLDSTSFNATAGDFRVLSVDENYGANSTLRVVLAFHEDTHPLTAAQALGFDSGNVVASNGAVYALSELTPYVTLTATGTAFTGACELAGWYCSVAAGTITIYDNTSATGTPIVPATTLAAGPMPIFGAGTTGKLSLTTGCHVVLSGAATVRVLVG